MVGLRALCRFLRRAAMARWTKWTAKKENTFLDYLREGHTVKAACDLIGCPRSTAYLRRDNDPEFAAAWDEARIEGAEVLEEEAFRRAVKGWEEPVFHQGVQTAHVRKHSDTLLIFLMKGAMPEKYKDRVQQEVSGPDGKAIPITTILVEKPDGVDDSDG